MPDTETAVPAADKAALREQHYRRRAHAEAWTIEEFRAHLASDDYVYDESDPADTALLGARLTAIDPVGFPEGWAEGQAERVAVQRREHPLWGYTFSADQLPRGEARRLRAAEKAGA